MSDLKQTVYLRQDRMSQQWIPCGESCPDAVAFDRRTQPEATAPAQDLSDDAGIRVVNYIEAFDKRLTARGFTHAQRMEIVGLLVSKETRDKALSPANALSAGDSEPMTLVKKGGQPYAAYPRRKQAEVYATGLSSGADVQIIDGVFIAAILQSQKDNHG